MASSPSVQSTASKHARAPAGAPSTAAWERVADRIRLRLPEKPNISTVFGRAGLRKDKIGWMRRQPNLRSDVVVKLARALRVSPENFFKQMVKEAKIDRLGEVHFG